MADAEYKIRRKNITIMMMMMMMKELYVLQSQNWDVHMRLFRVLIKQKEIFFGLWCTEKTPSSSHP